jgi:hypothetical protein
MHEDVRTLKNDCVRKIDIKFNVNEEVRRILYLPKLSHGHDFLHKNELQKIKKKIAFSLHNFKKE